MVQKNGDSYSAHGPPIVVFFPPGSKPSLNRSFVVVVFSSGNTWPHPADNWVDVDRLYGRPIRFDHATRSEPIPYTCSQHSLCCKTHERTRGSVAESLASSFSSLLPIPSLLHGRPAAGSPVALFLPPPLSTTPTNAACSRRRHVQARPVQIGPAPSQIPLQEVASLQIGLTPPRRAGGRRCLVSNRVMPPRLRIEPRRLVHAVSELDRPAAVLFHTILGHHLCLRHHGHRWCFFFFFETSLVLRRHGSTSSSDCNVAGVYETLPVFMEMRVRRARWIATSPMFLKHYRCCRGTCLQAHGLQHHWCF